jgi:hypothetical protein
LSGEYFLLPAGKIKFEFEVYGEVTARDFENEEGGKMAGQLYPYVTVPMAE